ncbi:hypothetical protein TKK_0006021 [Trichogramma kaykai]|uniref:C2H2-type domain-containing protein n=1 Tax=Trichogramma kaykai TaxID=54128 RepID=A0ABD2XFE9_9HYME
MLHSALPQRTYLAGVPGLGYHLGAAAAVASYFDELHQQHPYVTASAYHQQQQQQQQHQFEEAYAFQRLSEQRLLAWDAQQQQQQQQQQHHQPHHPLQHQQQHKRAETPSPLDLSVKSSSTENAPVVGPDEPIEVDDEEDRRSREEARLHRSAAGFYDDDQDSQRSCSSVGLSVYHPTPRKQLLLSASSSPLQSCHLTPSSHHSGQTQPQQQHAPMTPPSTPSPPNQPYHHPPSLKRKEIGASAGSGSSSVTPTIGGGGGGGRAEKSAAAAGALRGKKKHVRRLKFDEDTSSPVSGTVILGPDEAIVTGDIDPAFNIVEVTEEARAELAKIENRLGPYQCKLCRQLHDDAFQLAQHRCSRIAHVEYRCPECDKRFSCPANLASHRRWHKPRPAAGGGAAASATATQDELACTKCEAKFAKQSALKKHMAQQHPNEQNNNNTSTTELMQVDATSKLAALDHEMA